MSTSEIFAFLYMSDILGWYTTRIDNEEENIREDNDYTWRDKDKVGHNENTRGDKNKVGDNKNKAGSTVPAA